MTPAEFESAIPVSERPQTHALDPAATNKFILHIIIIIISIIIIIFSGSAAQRCLWPPRSQGFLITHNDAPQSVGLLWTSDQFVAETST
jgi:hypothetical protein